MRNTPRSRELVAVFDPPSPTTCFRNYAEGARCGLWAGLGAPRKMFPGVALGAPRPGPGEEDPMRMSVSRQLGYVQVRGGHVKIVSQAHEVSTASYNRGPDEARGRVIPRAFHATTMTAHVGDLALEIIAVGTERLLGFGYLSGDAINLYRYVHDADRDQVSGWMANGSGLRFTLPDPTAAPEQAREILQRVRSGGTDVAVARYEVGGPLDVQGAARALARIFETSHPTAAVPTTDVLITVAHKRQQPSACLHCQIPRRTQGEASQPFFHALLYSSPHLEEAPWTT